ncbi:MAG: 2-oxoacid:acceptor oxidoreductase family protein [Clostridia bacterium]|nr:2-oxoacid:acceptor oxidoreductase family protein [Clostridia bacterium]
MSQTQFLFSGFGGQGILFAGKFLAYKGLMEDRQVSWLPSYGPEMRGGTASCSVILSDEPVGSPIVTRPDVLVAMNLPSLDKYEDAVAPGGIIFADSTLIERKVNRTDVTTYYIPATKLAGDNGIPTLANMIIVGKLLAVLGEYKTEAIETTLGKVISARKAAMLEANYKALQIGADFE